MLIKHKYENHSLLYNSILESNWRTQLRVKLMFIHHPGAWGQCSIFRLFQCSSYMYCNISAEPSRLLVFYWVYSYFMLHQLVVRFFTNFIDKYCVLHMWQKQSCDLNMQKAPKKLWQLRLPCDFLRCDKLWFAIKHESILWTSDTTRPVHSQCIRFIRMMTFSA